MSLTLLRAPFAGWLTTLEAVPDAVFAQRMMGDGFAIDPTEGVLRAPADARVISIPETRHAVTLALDDGIEVLIHIGIDTVRLAGEGFVAHVKSGDRVRAGDPLIEFDLDAVAAHATDLITPVIILGKGSLHRLIDPGKPVTTGETVAALTAEVAPHGPDPSQHASIERSVRIEAPLGIHARPAARIGALLSAYTSDMQLLLGERSADARSVVALLGLGVRHGDVVIARAAGADAAAALDAFAEFATQHFGDTDAPAPARAPVQRSGPVRAAPGLAIGTILQWRSIEFDVPRDGAGEDAERAALSAAVATTRDALARGGTAGDILEAHRALLADPALAAVAETHISAGRSAAFAWRAAAREAAATISATGDALLVERVADLRDIEQQVLAHLAGPGSRPAPSLPKGTILVAEDLLPSEFLTLDAERLVGICTAAGGPTAHVAILAAAAGIPMIVAAGPTVLDIAEGSTAILDADDGQLLVSPEPAKLDAVSNQIAANKERRTAAIRSAHADCVMADGTRIEVFANLGSIEDAAMAVAAGAEGCGLLRTEFLFLDRKTAPDEEEQRALYSRIATILDDRPLIVRTFDIGGDKPVDYLPASREENPALGLRGVRLALARPDLLVTQLRAVLKGIPAEQCRIMIPMIVDLGELRAVRALLDEAAAAVGGSQSVQLGVMIETPAAALLADQIAGEADFLSIGTNDLTQYTLACDRTNAAVSAQLDPLHPSVLRLIAKTAAGARSHGRWTGVCGGLASDPMAAPLLVGLGVTELSAAVSAIPMVKQVLRGAHLAACTTLAEKACAATSAAEVRALIEEHSI